MDENTRKKKRKEKKKSSKRNHEDADGLEGHEREDKSTKETRKEEKRKKKSKRSKTKGAFFSENEEKNVQFSEKKRRSCEALDLQHMAESQTLTGSKTEKIVASSAIEFYDEQIKKSDEEKAQKNFKLSLLLFYQYIEPVWDEPTYNFILKSLQDIGKELDLTGRMRVAREGLNCTLTGTQKSIVQFCISLRELRPTEFDETEFKMTNDLPQAQRFPNLKVFKVVELVHYGLEGSKAPPIAKFQGTHLEPKDYHEKLGESNTVIIDVRNHYEVAIGRFVPPASAASGSPDDPPPKWIDPKMRKSTEFPVWLDKPEVKEQMKGKQVLMYCTGGIRCERASALLKYKMEMDPEIKKLGIRGVFQLQGGIDKYFKQFPDGGYWQGKNYVFDKRFAHAPPKIDGKIHSKGQKEEADGAKFSRCEACMKPWDMYRGKRRCPTCGVPSLICRACVLADKEGRQKLGKNVRCDLCVEQNVTSKRQLREKDEHEIQEYEEKMSRKGLLKAEETAQAPNPDKVTRLVLRNMCRSRMDEATLLEILPRITHIVWKIDRKTGKFLGGGWVEMASHDDAARAVALNGKLSPFGRPLYIAYQSPHGKDVWPPPNSAVR